MSNLSIVKNPNNFRDAFLTDVQNRSLNSLQNSVMTVLLYYVWRGLYNCVTTAIKGEGKSEIVLMCTSTYKAFLPLIHLIRMGYTGDTFILLRSLMERIALLGYLNENQSLIGKYKAGKLNLPDEALKWAKGNNSPNWIRLYSLLTNLAHQRRESIGGSLFDENAIGDAIRYMLPSSKPNPSLIDEALAILWFGILSTDLIAKVVLPSKEFPSYQEDANLRKYIDNNDIQIFEKFLQDFVSKYTKLRTE